jgi:hypothetical protein
MKNYEAKKYLRISTILDPRFKNHPNIFTAAERMENQALLEGEFLNQNESEHPTLERTNSNSICNELSDDDPFENLLMPRISDQPTSSHTQTTRVREEIEAFFKVKFIFY